MRIKLLFFLLASALLLTNILFLNSIIPFAHAQTDENLTYERTDFESRFQITPSIPTESTQNCSTLLTDSNNNLYRQSLIAHSREAPLYVSTPLDAVGNHEYLIITGPTADRFIARDCAFAFAQFSFNAPTFAALTSATLTTNLEYDRFADHMSQTPISTITQTNCYITMVAISRDAEHSTISNTIAQAAYTNPTDPTDPLSFDIQNCADLGRDTTLSLSLAQRIFITLNAHLQNDIYIAYGIKSITPSEDIGYGVGDNANDNPTTINATWTTHPQNIEIISNTKTLTAIAESNADCSSFTSQPTISNLMLLYSGNSICSVIASSFFYSIPEQNQLFAASVHFTVSDIVNPLNCDIRIHNTAPSDDSAQYAQAHGSLITVPQNIALDSDVCTTTGDKTIEITDTATLNIIGTFLRDTNVNHKPYLTISFHDASFGGNIHSATISDITITITEDSEASDPVDDLMRVETTTSNAIRLVWSQPDPNSGTILGYQIVCNGSCGDNIILTNSTTTLSYLHQNLDRQGIYRYDINVWSEVNNEIILVPNIRGIVVQPSSDADLGSLAPIRNTNPLKLFPITFTALTAINDDEARIRISYDETEDPSCHYFYGYKTWETHQLSNIGDLRSTANPDRFNKDLTFQSIDNSSVTIICKNPDATYTIQQLEYPILNILQDFRDGTTYGTSGSFGSLDIITFMVILISMVGFQRKNEVMGVLISVFTVFIMAWLDLITAPTIMISAMTVLIAFTIIQKTKR